ncbi:ethanolamine utilization protein EutN [Bacillus ectoiniformans]|uniref:EutN/CcmL family microcompartment protein n=1 Tax=Bacillus ectoiniformans TaxID=1494429 RepID=UPI00195AD353|nr:EutN/CcmL family microcompartment protein [Bacillus ectoiniformans]MBM7649292.1 ethanolamine utilization protein EutN [Bacillus ectoiniformans]
MKLGTVIGNVWATRKEDGLTGLKLLFVQPIHPNGTPIHSPIIAADRIGAGMGDQVIITEGGSARFITPDTPLPIDAVIIGIVDSTEIERGE